MRSRVLWLAPTTLVLALVALAGCDGGHLLSQDQEVQLGRQAGDEFQAKYGLDPSATDREEVTRIGARIAAVARPPDYPYDYRVLNTSDVNANAFPGGRIYVWRGLLTAVHHNTDELAWVIGHETAHVARRHVTKRLERELGTQFLIDLIFRKPNAAQVASSVAGLVMLDYGRDQEYEADRWGLTYCHRAGYDPTAAIQVLHTFQKLQGKEPSKAEIFFETHPGNNQRIDAVKAYLKEQGWGGQYYKP